MAVLQKMAVLFFVLLTMPIAHSLEKVATAYVSARRHNSLIFAHKHLMRNSRLQVSEYELSHVIDNAADILPRVTDLVLHAATVDVSSKHMISTQVTFTPQKRFGC